MLMKCKSTVGKILKGTGAVTALWLLLPAQQAMALPVDLGAAAGFTVLEIGGGSIDAGTLGLSNPQGLVAGNAGIGQNGSIHDADVVIQGDLFLANGATASFSGLGQVAGTIHSDSAAKTLLDQANTDALAAAKAAAALASSGGGLGVSSITKGGDLTPGIYNLSTLNLPNAAVLNLAAGGSYVFNISGGLVMHSSDILLASGLSESEVLFNITGTTAVAFSGGGNGSEVHGIILAPSANINLSPGLVIGEVISGQNIQIVSGAEVHSSAKPPVTVPDAGSSLLLMSLSLGFLVTAKRKFLS